MSNVLEGAFLGSRVGMNRRLASERSETGLDSRQTSPQLVSNLPAGGETRVMQR